MMPPRRFDDNFTVRTPAERVADRNYQREQRRSTALKEQHADTNSPEVRIRAWERMHELNMPSGPDHPVLDVIAVDTRLELAAVQEEQRLRASRIVERKSRGT